MKSVYSKYVCFIFFSIAFSFSTAAQEFVDTNVCPLSIPSVLNANDASELYISTDCIITGIKFQIFNRWGNLLYETEQYSVPLDFDLTQKDKKGNPIYQSGTYYWVCTYSYLFVGSEEEKSISGHITIIL